ncbi:hypothetical protein AALO_G00272880, partial [Alosa alosa]
MKVGCRCGVGGVQVGCDSPKVSTLILLDLSAAFDTIDHSILIHRLAKWVGLSDNALNWFQTNITGRDFYISLGDHVSEKHDLPFGV